jgi:DUF3014 family protein
MPDIPDLRLRQSTVSDDIDTGDMADLFVDEQVVKEDHTKWIVLIVLFFMSAVVVGYIVFQRQRTKTPLAVEAPVTAPAAPAPAKPATGPLVQAENIPLPPLAETDALVRQLLVKLSSHPKVLAWLATNGLIENFTVATLNLSDGKSPALMHWRNLTPEGRFSVIKTPAGTSLDAKSYRRYDAYAAAINALDPPGTARLYLTLKPRIMEAYRNLGFPEGDFDPVLERAMHELITTPAISNEIPLREKVITYQFVDPNVESLSGAQKQLLRMGPENMRIVQNKLKDIAVQLGLHP